MGTRRMLAQYIAAAHVAQRQTRILELRPDLGNARGMPLGA